MKQKTFSSRSYLIASFFLAAALTVEQIFINLRFYDFEASLWQHETPGIVKGLLYITLAIIMLFAGAYLYSSRNVSQREVGLEKPDTPLRGAALFCALSLFATLVAQIAAIGSLDHLYLLLVSGSTDHVAIAAFLHRVTLILVPFACLWFVWLARGKQPTVGLGILPIVYFMFLTMRVYFDMNTLLTDPRWGFRITTLVFAMLFMLAEVNLLLHKKRSLLHYLVSLPAFCILTTSSVTNLAFNISGHFADGIEIVYFVLELAFAAYIAIRMIALSKDTAPEEEPAKEIVLVSKEEAEEAEETDTESEEEFADEEDDGEIADLTEDEVKRFYKAVTVSVRRRVALSNPPTAEEEAKVKEESLAIIAAVLRTEDRSGRISAVRAFLAKAEKTGNV
ncbi:MAG: hypothetical protein J6S34_01380 [Clostridia bacterium]|nr:hypothetical protein [Clostridia bacterium]